MSPHASFSQRLTQLLLAILAVAVGGLLLRPYLPIAAAAAKSSSVTPSATYDTITVQRINVADADGTTRLIIANSTRLPGAIIHGKEYPEASMTRRACYSWIRRARRPAVSRWRNCATTMWQTLRSTTRISWQMASESGNKRAPTAQSGARPSIFSIADRTRVLSRTVRGCRASRSPMRTRRPSCWFLTHRAYRSIFGPVYPASKTALNALTVAMALELEREGIKVNAVSPGFTKTNLNGYAGTETVKDGAREAVRVALLGPDSPTGTFTRWENETIPWWWSIERGAW
jgi:NAD(P)-dependent dehydrogenase (short-subunit alcohol dehydrogenase family)